jgi:hypothetical protein
MDCACAGAFDHDKPPLLLLRDDVGVDLQWIDRTAGKSYPDAPLSGAREGDPESLMARRALNGDEFVMSRIMPHCWAHRSTAMAVVRDLGVNAVFPSSWFPDLDPAVVDARMIDPMTHPGGAMKVIEKSLNEIVECHGLEGFNDPIWNLGQIVAWIWTRSPFPVDALSSETECLASRNHSMQPGIPHLALEFAQRCANENGLEQIRPQFADLDQVCLTLLRSFKAGKLSASGRHIESNGRKTIDVLDWADLVIGEGLTGELIVRHRGTGHAAWNDVIVERDLVLKVFSEGKSSSREISGHGDRDEPGAGTSESAIKTIDLKVVDTQQSRGLARSIEEVFPEGALLEYVKQKLESSAHFKRVGLKLKSLKDGSYDSSLKRILRLVRG